MPPRLLVTRAAEDLQRSAVPAFSGGNNRRTIVFSDATPLDQAKNPPGPTPKRAEMGATVTHLL